MQHNSKELNDFKKFLETIKGSNQLRKKILELSYDIRIMKHDNNRYLAFLALMEAIQDRKLIEENFSMFLHVVIQPMGFEGSKAFQALIESIDNIKLVEENFLMILDVVRDLNNNPYNELMAFRALLIAIKDSELLSKFSTQIEDLTREVITKFKSVNHSSYEYGMLLETLGLLNELKIDEVLKKVLKEEIEKVKNFHKLGKTHADIAASIQSKEPEDLCNNDPEIYFSDTIKKSGIFVFYIFIPPYDGLTYVAGARSMEDAIDLFIYHLVERYLDGDLSKIFELETRYSGDITYEELDSNISRALKYLELKCHYLSNCQVEVIDKEAFYKKLEREEAWEAWETTKDLYKATKDLYECIDKDLDPRIIRSRATRFTSLHIKMQQDIDLDMFYDKNNEVPFEKPIKMIIDEYNSSLPINGKKLNLAGPYLKKIIKKTGFSLKEIHDLVIQKKEELKGQISDDGALFLIAEELGLKLRGVNYFH